MADNQPKRILLAVMPYEGEVLAWGLDVDFAGIRLIRYNVLDLRWVGIDADNAGTSLRQGTGDLAFTATNIQNTLAGHANRLNNRFFGGHAVFRVCHISICRKRG